jgi:uncharacterized spore protein YtfJ
MRPSPSSSSASAAGAGGGGGLSAAALMQLQSGDVSMMAMHSQDSLDPVRDFVVLLFKL